MILVRCDVLVEEAVGELFPVFIQNVLGSMTIPCEVQWYPAAINVQRKSL